MPRDLFEEDSASRLELRPHQQDALDMIRRSFGSGNRRVMLQASVAFGKTLCAARMIEGALAKGRRVLFTAPVVALIDQAVARLENEGIRDIGVMQADHPRTNPLARVQVATVQTLARREAPDVGLAIVDEAHLRSTAIEKLMAARPDLPFVGLSATPWSKGLGLHWDDLVVPISMRTLIGQGFLSQYSALAPDMPDLSKVRVSRGEYVEDALREVMGEAQLMGSVVETWLEHGENHPTLVFCVNRAHAADMHAAFIRAGVASAYVDGEVDSVERRLIFHQFARGEVKVICSVRTMTTGVDLAVSCIVDAAPTRSEILHVQKLGRGLRVNPGTEDCLILDHAGNLLRLGMPDEIMHPGMDCTEKGKQEARAKPERLPKPCPACSVLFSGRTCPACGHERVPQAGVEVADGKLVEIKRGKVDKVDKQVFWSMALRLDDMRGRGGKLAKGLYKGRFGVWPRMLSNHRIDPDQEFLNYEKSRRIAWAKRMEGKRAS